MIPTVLRLLYDFFSLKNDINLSLSESNKQKNSVKNFFLVGVLKVTDEKCRTWYWNRIHKSETQIRIGTKMSRIRNTAQDST